MFLSCPFFFRAITFGVIGGMDTLADLLIGSFTESLSLEAALILYRDTASE